MRLPLRQPEMIAFDTLRHPCVHLYVELFRSAFTASTRTDFLRKSPAQTGRSTRVPVTLLFKTP